MGSVITNPDQMMMPDVWDGTAKNMLVYPSVTITCTVAPATPRAILGGPTQALATAARTAFADTGTGTLTGVTTIGAVDRYDMSGGEWLALGGSTSDGTFYISGGQ